MSDMIALRPKGSDEIVGYFLLDGEVWRCWMLGMNIVVGAIPRSSAGEFEKVLQGQPSERDAFYKEEGGWVQGRVIATALEGPEADLVRFEILQLPVKNRAR